MTETRGPRLSNEAIFDPDQHAGVQQMIKSIRAVGVPAQTLELVHMRASQINGCAACMEYGTQSAAKSGLSTERLVALAGWYESTRFSDPERAALGLTDAMTRLADRPGAVTDEIWQQVVEHYDERASAALVSMIALTNFFNRINTTLKVQPGAWG
ncbi:MAG: carboxymuconolactone decarboxylase family protein [Solirubrobacteraceae bacterium]